MSRPYKEPIIINGSEQSFYKDILYEEPLHTTIHCSVGFLP